MKKLLTIMVLSLLFSLKANAEIIKYECKYVSGSWPGNLEYINYQLDLKNMTASSQWVYEGKYDEDEYKIESIDDEKVFLRNSDKKFKNDAWFFNYATDQRVYNDEINNNYDCKYNKNFASSALDKKNKVEMTTMINKAKETCEVLGFKEDTDKFADCALKLYSQSVELAAEQNKTVVMQPQSSGSNVMTIYDPVRDSNALIKKGQRMLSGACTLGIDC